MKPNFFRVYMGNEIFRPEMMKQVPKILRPLIKEKDWRSIASKRRLARIQNQPTEDGAFILRTAFYLSLKKSMLAIDYLIEQDGSLTIAYQAVFKQSPPRLGLKTTLPIDMNQVTWFGRGSIETMRNRKAGGKFGKYESTAEALTSNYILPQENGNRSDTSWLEIRNQNGEGLRISAIPIEKQSTFNFTLWDYTSEDILNPKHMHEVNRGKTITLQLDVDQRGVNELGEMIFSKSEYMLPKNKKYAMKIKITPFEK